MYNFRSLINAKSVEDAIRLRAENPSALILAGGSDLFVKMRSKDLSTTDLISIYGIDELRGVSIEPDGDIRIGSLTSFSHISDNDIIKRLIPVLGQAAGTVGGPQVRNIGTIGGNTCNGVTSADTASTCFALDAVIELTGADGKRLVPIQQFYIKAGRVDIRPTEIQTSVIIPYQSYKNCFGFYQKYSMRNAMDIATLNCSCNVRLSGDGAIVERARIAYGVAAPIPMRALSAEAAVAGLAATDETAKLFADAAITDINPRDSWRASKAFRTHMAHELAMRGLTECIRRAVESL